MLRKIFILTIAVLLCVSIAGCSSDGKKYAEVKDAQASVINLNSGKITIVSQVEAPGRSDSVKSEFTFKYNQSNVLSYLQTQFDKSDREIFAEYSDGEKTEQWFIGKGWAVSDNMQYTKENLHRYLRLLSTPFDKKAINSIEVDETAGTKQYILSMSPKVLNETIYEDTDIEVVKQSIIITVNDQNELTAYLDQAKIKDKASGQESDYTLEMIISEQNAVESVNRPELRDYSGTAE